MIKFLEKRLPDAKSTKSTNDKDENPDNCDVTMLSQHTSRILIIILLTAIVFQKFQ